MVRCCRARWPYRAAEGRLPGHWISRSSHSGFEIRDRWPDAPRKPCWLPPSPLLLPSFGSFSFRLLDRWSGGKAMGSWRSCKSCVEGIDSSCERAYMEITRRSMLAVTAAGMLGRAATRPLAFGFSLYGMKTLSWRDGLQNVARI